MGSDLRRRVSSRHHPSLLPTFPSDANSLLFADDVLPMRVAEPNDQLVIGFRWLSEQRDRADATVFDVARELTGDLAKTLRQMGHEVIETASPHNAPCSSLLRRCDVVHSYAVGDVPLDLSPETMWDGAHPYTGAPGGPARIGSIFAAIETESERLPQSQGNRPGFDGFHREFAGADLLSYSRAQANSIDRYRTMWGVSPEFASVVPPGLDLGRYPFEATPDNYLAAVSDFQPGCGLDHAIELATRVGIPMRFAGTIASIEQRRYFAEEIRPLLTSGVEYVGSLDRDERIKFLGRARGYVELGWRRYPFDLCALEALAGGTPVISTQSGAAGELVSHEVNGFLASTPGSLISAILALDRIDRNRCRHEVERSHNVERSALEFEAFYYNVLDRNRAMASIPRRPKNEFGKVTTTALALANQSAHARSDAGFMAQRLN